MASKKQVRLAQVAAPIYGALLVASTRKVPLDDVVVELDRLALESLTHARTLIRLAQVRTEKRDG